MSIYPFDLTHWDLTNVDYVQTYPYIIQYKLSYGYTNSTLFHDNFNSCSHFFLYVVLILGPNKSSAQTKGTLQTYQLYQGFCNLAVSHPDNWKYLYYAQSLLGSSGKVSKVVFINDFWFKHYVVYISTKRYIDITH